MLIQPFLCCRVWPVNPLYPVGSCGVCGQRPRPLVQAAKALATAAHGYDTDRSGKPYIDHPARVAAAVRDDPYAETVAWLHDVVEDTEVTLFGLEAVGYPDAVLKAVDAISKRPGEELEHYLRRVVADDLAYVVKLADVADNSSEDRLASLDAATQQRLRAKYERTKSLLVTLRSIATRGKT